MRVASAEVKQIQFGVIAELGEVMLAELLGPRDQLSLLLGHLHIALGKHDLAMTRL